MLNICNHARSIINLEYYDSLGSQYLHSKVMKNIINIMKSKFCFSFQTEDVEKYKELTKES